MKICFLLRRSIPAILGTLLLLNQSPVSAANWGGAAAGAVQGAANAAQALAESALQRQREEQQLKQQLEQQKELLRYQNELEMQRQRAEQESRKQALEKEQQEKEAAEKEAERTAMNTGSGFFVDSTGHLITNAHVVNDKTYVAIRDFKGKFYRATVISQDKQNDLALLQVDGSFPSLRIVRSDQAEKGQRVLTVGYPQISIQGNESKVTDGIINSFSGIENDDKWFQISVPIQGGNSGGPLVNENGDVLGVVVASLNVQKFYSITGSMPQNVNYAIKSELLMQFLSSQKVSNPSHKKGKTSINAVDQSTVLVVAKNDPIEVTYEERPINKKAEDTKLTQLHPNWRSLIQSNGFKKWLVDTPSVKDSFESQRASSRAKVLGAYNQYVTDQQEFTRLAAVEEERRKNERQALELVARRNDEVIRAYPDWPKLEKNPDFLDWLAKQPEPTRQIVGSLKATDIISLIKLYKEQPAEKLIEIGRVQEIFENYGYIVFALNNQGYQQIDNVIILSNGRKIQGIAEKRAGENVSVTIKNDDIRGMYNGAPVFVAQ